MTRVMSNKRNMTDVMSETPWSSDCGTWHGATTGHGKSRQLSLNGESQTRLARANRLALEATCASPQPRSH